MFNPKYFDVRELVPKSAYKDRGELAIELLDPRLLITLDALRERYGLVVVNTWLWGGSSQWRGLRTDDCPLGAKYSQHKYGRAADCTFTKTTTEEVIADILEKPSMFPYITSLELGVSHFHFDVRNCDPIKTYYPNS